MKYLIKNRCINADQIVMAEYVPEIPDEWIPEEKHLARCNITLTSIVALELDHVATSERITLIGDEANRFWDYYADDALTVVSP